jgi:hypothetical protein
MIEPFKWQFSFQNFKFILSDSGSAKLEIDVAHPDDNSIQGGYYLILRDYG